jgi:eukaryotic-like serine/threonine-protein kinase
MPLAAGVKLGPYELATSIGAGGMGEVYRAHDRRLGRDVAVKIITASFASDASRVRRFEQEARAAAALNHPNILAVYDIGTHDDCPYIVSELLEGKPLRDRLRDGPLPIRKVIDYALQIARGLAAAHDRGIVHRDLKPDNIFITEDGRVKILDFGLAKLTRPETGIDDQTKTVESDPGTVLGTVGYMSPEQVRGKEAEARSDLFSFGTVLYEMISGKRAFKGDSSADILSAILKEEPPDLAAMNRDASPALERIVRHCLEKNPAERFQSAHDLAFDLEALPGSSKLASDVHRSGARKRAWLLLVLVVVLAVTLGAAFLLGRTTRSVSRPEFHQVTFRSGTVYRARFANDGTSILYSAAWEGPRSLAADTLVAAISSKNQVAVLLNPRFSPVGSIPLAKGTLALLPIEGGAPRPVLQDVQYADWTPDGSDLAILRAPEGETLGFRTNVLQFPIDKTIYTPLHGGWLSDVRFSPDGKYLAFEEHIPTGDDGKVVVVDLAGKKIAESAHYSAVNGMAWARNQEVWFTGSPGEPSRAVMAMDLRGRTREVYRAPGDLTIYDIAANGRVLLSADNSRKLLFGGAISAPDKDLSWLGWSLAAGISDDGSTVLFSESAYAVGGRPVVLIRKLDRSPAVELGEGFPMEISPDGNWVATLDSHDPPNVVLLPTGVGKPKQLTSNGWDYTPTRYWIRWMPNRAALSLMAVQPGHKPKMFLLDVATKEMRPLLPEGIRGGLPSPDGKLLFGIDGNTPKIYTMSGTEVRALPQLGPDDVPDRWAADGKSLFIWNCGATARLDQMDVNSGRRTSVTVIRPPDTTGIVGYTHCRTSKDGKAHIYSAYRLLTDLFVVNGLR